MPGFEVIHENLQRQCGIVTTCQVHLIVELVQQQVLGQYDSRLPHLWLQPFIELFQLRSGVSPTEASATYDFGLRLLIYN